MLDSDGPTVTDSQRARELYKYICPDSQLIVPFENNILASQAELVALRLNCRCLINLIDASHQYRVAEATPESAAGVDDGSPAELEQWRNGRIVAPETSLCYSTLNVSSFYEVVDLHQDPRFREAAFIAGPPYFKYYFGLPLRTKDGVGIGALAIVDSQPRTGINTREHSFLKRIRDNIMTYFELERSNHERERAFQMNASLNLFVDPGHGPSDPLSKSNVDRDSLSRISSVVSALPGPEDPYKRAADLLHRSLVLGENGGVLFVDTATSTSRRGSDVSDAQSDLVRRPSMTWRRASSQGPCRVIASSTSSDPASTQEHKDLYLSLEQLSRLVTAYPHGNLWALGDKELPRQPEEVHLSEAFPGATSLFMLPIWDSRSNRWTALFAYSTSLFRTFAADIDVPHMVSFGNCIAVELIRQATVAIARQKGDFIGSVSHELRSPLHGILASIELLQDTHLSPSQKSLLEQANSCGRGLLDTISMVLDYSKINDLEQDSQPGQHESLDFHKLNDSSQYQERGHEGSIDFSLRGVVDLADIVEEAVENAAISHDFQILQHTGVAPINSRSNRRKRRGLTQPTTGPPVEIALDISNTIRSSWTYTTRPAAFRCIVTHLISNSMKYTLKGSIKVTMKVEQDRSTDMNPLHDPPFDLISLNVVDTGKGMSPDFLDSRIFLPFAQEDTLSPGLGLGLALVKDLVAMLDGDIRIKSAVNGGTSVYVNIPMQQAPKIRTNTLKSVNGTYGALPSVTMEAPICKDSEDYGNSLNDTSKDMSVETAQTSSRFRSHNGEVRELSSPRNREKFQAVLGPEKKNTNSALKEHENDKSRGDLLSHAFFQPIPSSQSPHSKPPPRILLVDDNSINLKILEAFMKKLKYTTYSSACNGAEACQLFGAVLASAGREPTFDVIFLDLNMPIMDGFDAARQIRAFEREHAVSAAMANEIYIPTLIIALTGLASESDQCRAFDAGVDFYMTKPASFKEVSRQMQAWEANRNPTAFSSTFNTLSVATSTDGVVSNNTNVSGSMEQVSVF